MLRKTGEEEGGKGGEEERRERVKSKKGEGKLRFERTIKPSLMKRQKKVNITEKDRNPCWRTGKVERKG